MDALFTKLRSLDAHPKVNEDFYSRTLPGGIITVVSSIIMFLLFVSEIRLYLHPSTETKLVVDTSRGERLRINFDVTFPALQCSVVSLDAMDISGEEHLDVRHDIIKKRIDVHGNVIEVRQDGIGAPKIEKPLQRHGGRLEHNETYCGSCYGAEMSVDDCCNSCEEVREAYSKKGWGLSDPDMIDQCKREGFLQRIKDEEGEGCTIYGFLDVNRVAGNFHFAPGKSFQQSNMHVHDLLSFQKESYNISHKINRLTFGDFFPGVFNPLDGVQWIQHTPYGMYKYFIKVVPTVYTHMSGHTIQSNQFSVTEHFKADDIGQHQSIPGVFFFYDLSPIKVSMEDEASKSVDSVKENQDKEPSLTDVIVHRIKVSNQENTAKSVDAVKEIEIEDTTINPKKISRKAKGKSKKRPRKDIETDDAKQTTPRKKDEHVGHPAVEEIAETQTPSKELDVDLEEEELADTDSDFDPNAEKMNVDLDQEVLPDTDSDFDLKAEKMRKKAKGKAIIEQPVAKSRSLKETEEGTNSGSFSIKKPIKQAIFRTAYSIRQFYDAVSKLSSEQIQAVEEMGFSKILQIKLRTLPRSFIKRICDTVDPEARHMNLGVNGILPITPADVQFVLGVPAGPELFRVKDRHAKWKEDDLEGDG